MNSKTWDIGGIVGVRITQNRKPTLTQQDKARRIFNKVRRCLPLVTRLTCHDCGRAAQEWDHYRGYDCINAVMVQPVCRLCHTERTWSRK